MHVMCLLAKFGIRYKVPTLNDILCSLDRFDSAIVSIPLHGTVLYRVRSLSVRKAIAVGWSSPD